MAGLLGGLVGAMASGEVEVVDLSGTLGSDTPLLKLPPELAVDTPPVEIHKISAYDENGPHSPGPTAEAVQYLIDKGITGWGQETIGTDAGSAGGMELPFPAHNLLHANDRYGLASLAHLDRLPPKGAILIAAPLKIKEGTGSPVRAMALVPKH